MLAATRWPLGKEKKEEAVSGDLVLDGAMNLFSGSPRDGDKLHLFILCFVDGSV